LKQRVDAMTLAARSHHSETKAKSLMKGRLIPLPKDRHRDVQTMPSIDMIPKTISFTKWIDVGSDRTDFQKSDRTRLSPI
jgi:hypothetical protein